MKMEELKKLKPGTVVVAEGKRARPRRVVAVDSRYVALERVGRPAKGRRGTEGRGKRSGPDVTLRTAWEMRRYFEVVHRGKAKGHGKVRPRTKPTVH